MKARAWFASTGAPPAWALIRYMMSGLLVGGALGAALPDVRGALLAALTGVVVAAAALAGRPESLAGWRSSRPASASS